MDSLKNKVAQYAKSRQRSVDLDNQLGHGEDGIVWATRQRTAIKCLYRDKNYVSELACYLRFRHHRVKNIGQFTVPQLIDYDDALLVIEMEIVKPPFVLDFGKAYLESPPFADDPILLQEYDEQLRDRWGARYGEVASLLWALQRDYGIHYMDPKPGNISFAEEE